MKTPHFDRIQPQYCINAKLRKLHRMINNAYMQRLKPYGLRGSMLSMLFIIGKMENVNQKTLADKLVLDQSTVSRDVKKLLNKHWIAIIKGGDPRNTFLKLTNQGKKILEEVSPVWEEMHLEMEALLGQFNIQQIDMITAAVGAHFK